MSRPSRTGGGGPSSWIGARPTAGATALLVAVIASFLVLAFVRQPEWIAAHLLLIPRKAFGPEPWQLVTSAFVHVHGMAMVSSAIGLWVFATAVEQRSDRTRMFTIFGAAQLAGAIATAGLARLFAPDLLFDGCSAGILGLVAAFGVLYGSIPLRFFGLVEMKARTMALLVMGLSIFTQLLNRELFSVAGGLVAILVGWAVSAGAAEKVAIKLERLRVWRLRRRYKVIPGGRTDGKRYLN